MVHTDLYKNLPTSDELPCSDDTPVDNEDQNFLPNYLLFLLELIWKERSDWYFGVDMGIYHTTGVSPKVPVVPDGFLSLGVLYYVIYNPEYWQRDRHQPLEIYKLLEGQYQIQIGEPYWMPEMELALGRSRSIVGGIEREILTWFNQQGDRYLSAEEQAQQAQAQAQQERQARLAAIPQLHQMGLSVAQIATALGLPVADVEARLQP